MDDGGNGKLIILDRTGSPIEKAQAATTPDLDPNFLKSWYQLFAGGSANDVSAVVRNPYARHAWVYSCVSAIASNISQLRACLYSKLKPEEVISNHPILDLMNRPNPMMTGSEFFEVIVLHLMLPTTCSPGGQCFILCTDDNGDPVDLVTGRLPVYMYPFSDELVKPNISGHIFKGWDYSHPSGEKIFFLPTQLVRIHLMNPYNWLLGLSPYSAIEGSVTTDAKASGLADKFMDNGANIGGVLTTDAKLNKIQGDDLKKMWQEQYEGWSKAGKTALLHSGLKYDQTSKSLIDIQFKDQRIMSREEIMAAYGVGKTILGITETINRATAQVEKELFWEDTLIPLCDRLWGGFNPQFIEYYDKRDLYGEFDYRNVQALKKDISTKIRNAGYLIEQGVPPNEAYKTIDLAINTKDYAWLDRPLVTGQRVDLETGEIIGNPIESVPAESEPEKSGLEKYLITQVVQDKSDKFWFEYVAKTLNLPEKKFKQNFIQFLVHQRNLFQDKVDEWANRNKFDHTKASRLTDFVIDLDEQNEDLIRMSKPIYQNAIELQALKLTDELGKLTTYDPTGPLVNKIKQDRFKHLKGINTTTFEKVGNQIEEVLKKNPEASIDVLAEQIKKIEGTIFGFRIQNSKTIARTEISSVASRLRFEIMGGEGIDEHTWITAGDEKVREDHVRDNGITVKIGEKFPNSGLEYPLQNGGEPEQIINCRCTTVAAESKR
jgi:HK97 family phage portal protein